MKTLQERFEEKYIPEAITGCWLWTGALSTEGYGRISMNNGLVQAHRIPWEMVHGAIPKGMELDHVCHCRACVNPEHVRLATRAENSRNSLLRSNNTSGYKGVSFYKLTHKWEAYIKADYKRTRLGFFDTKDLAYAAYCEAAKKYHGEFANFGERL